MTSVQAAGSAIVQIEPYVSALIVAAHASRSHQESVLAVCVWTDESADDRLAEVALSVTSPAEFAISLRNTWKTAFEAIADHVVKWAALTVTACCVFA